jgi:hypothetical protein
MSAETFVGVGSYPDYNGGSTADALKKYTLLFDCLALYGLDEVIDTGGFNVTYRDVVPTLPPLAMTVAFGSDIVAELEWLRSVGVLRDGKLSAQQYDQLAAHSVYSSCLSDGARITATLRQAMIDAFSVPKGPPFDPADSERAGRGMGLVLQQGPMLDDMVLRVTSVLLSTVGTVNAIPLRSIDQFSAGADTVVHVVLSSLPTPDDSTPWETIIEFRNDPDSRRKLVALRRWMRALAKESRPSNEIVEELEYLISEFEEHMRLHRMRINKSGLETVLTVGAEVLENLARLKFGKLVKIPFALRERKLALLEAERSAPGREIAYIVKARESFQHA